MNETMVDQVARAVLYEGYILYPYRPSVKNQQRWTFGGLCPRAYCEARDGAEAWLMQTQVLVRGSSQVQLAVKVRCLQVQPRTAATPTDSAALDHQPVEALEVDGVRYPTWQEAVEQTITVDATALRELADGPRQHDFTLPAHHHREPVRSASGETVGMLVRERQRIAGRVEVHAEPVGEQLFRATVVVSNRTPWQPPDDASRDEAMLRALVSTHVILELPQRDGAFISLMDPPADARPAADACRNVGCWPVLVGAEGEAHTMLASPIILYDHPRIAPESPGDLFDATEIDELLNLRILTLTEQEKREMAAVDERARALLERTESLARNELMALHGTRRDLRPATANQSRRIVIGDRVRLQPKRRADAFDLALAGRSATVVAVEEDYEGHTHLAVTVDDDPGRDFGAQGKPAHRFFFRPDEVELIDSSARSAT
ncbi:MAG: hypothetical protein ACODAQ_00315 [Phycisphaeraceae bacterium]